MKVSHELHFETHYEFNSICVILSRETKHDTMFKEGKGVPSDNCGHDRQTLLSSRARIVDTR